MCLINEVIVQVKSALIPLPGYATYQARELQSASDVRPRCNASLRSMLVELER